MYCVRVSFFYLQDYFHIQKAYILYKDMAHQLHRKQCIGTIYTMKYRDKYQTLNNHHLDFCESIS